MKYGGRYCPIENDFDLEQEINIAIDATKTFISKFNNIGGDVDDRRAILKAIATTVIDSIE